MEIDDDSTVEQYARDLYNASLDVFKLFRQGKPFQYANAPGERSALQEAFDPNKTLRNEIGHLETYAQQLRTELLSDERDPGDLRARTSQLHLGLCATLACHALEPPPQVIRNIQSVSPAWNLDRMRVDVAEFRAAVEKPLAIPVPAGLAAELGRHPRIAQLGNAVGAAVERWNYFGRTPLMSQLKESVFDAAEIALLTFKHKATDADETTRAFANGLVQLARDFMSSLVEMADRIESGQLEPDDAAYSRLLETSEDIRADVDDLEEMYRHLATPLFRTAWQADDFPDLRGVCERLPGIAH